MTQGAPPAREQTEVKLRNRTVSFGSQCLEAFHLAALFAIGAATIWAAGQAFWSMLAPGKTISIADLLLLFIYLEIGAMVGIYFQTNHMPVRFLIYIAITALTRHLVGYDISHQTPDAGLLYMTGSILILAFAVLALRYASSRFPSAPEAEPSAGRDRT